MKYEKHAIYLSLRTLNIMYITWIKDGIKILSLVDDLIYFKMSLGHGKYKNSDFGKS